MGLKVRFHLRAEADLQTIHDYLIQHANPRSAERVRTHLLQKIKRLSRLPYMGMATGEADIRILAPTRYPYRVYYVIQSDEVVILHIRHTARSPPDDLRL